MKFNQIFGLGKGMSRNLRIQFVFGKILNKVIESDKNVKKKSTSFTILLNRMISFTINLLDRSDLFQGCQTQSLVQENVQVSSPRDYFRMCTFFFHWYTAVRLGEHIWKSCRKLYIRIIVINFCRCPTLAYMAAMYTDMFCHFSFKVFTQETLVSLIHL